MNQRKTKQLRKTMLKKTAEVLTLIRSEFGQKTEQIERPQQVWRNFKTLYKMGKVPKSLLIVKGEK